MAKCDKMGLHPASHTTCLEISYDFVLSIGSFQLWLTIFQNRITQPLRSTSITETSTLLRAVPPLYPASVLSSLWGFHLDFSLYIGVVGSHVPHKSLFHVHAASIPATAWTVDRCPPDLSQVNDSPLVLMTSLRFRYFISGSLVFISMKHT